MSRFLLLIILNSIWLYTQAQQIEEKHVIRYSELNGLHSYNIRKIVQDENGFFWIATQDALYKFDGTHFIIYNKGQSKKHKLLGIDIRDLSIDSANHLLWVLGAEGGINGIDLFTGNVVTTIPIRETTADSWNITFLITAGNFWIGTSHGLKIQAIPDIFLHTSKKNISEITSHKKLEIRKLIVDKNNNLWAFATDYGCTIYNGNTGTVVREILKEKIVGNSNTAFFSDALCDNDTIIIATNSGLKKILYTKDYSLSFESNPYPELQPLASAEVRAIKKSPDDKLIVATNNALYSFKGNTHTVSVLKEEKQKFDDDWLSSVNSILFDKNKDLWLSCKQGVAYIPDAPNPFQPYNYDYNSLKTIEHVHSVFAQDEKIFIGLKNGLLSYDTAKRAFSKIDSSKLFYHIFATKEKKIIASCPDGIYTYSNSRLIPAYSVFAELSGVWQTPINSHVFIGDSIILLGTENSTGLIVWNTKKRTVRKLSADIEEKSLSANQINTIYKDKKGSIWVLSDKAITILTPNLLHSKKIQYIIPQTKEKYSIFFDLCEFKGSYWLAAYGNGILQIDTAYKILKQYSLKDGLSNDCVYKLFNYADSLLIITSNNGVSVLNAQSNHISNYYENDGLQSNAFEEACGQQTTDRIYVGGVRGFTIINPSLLNSNKVAPNLLITNVSITSKFGAIDSSNLKLSKFTVPPTTLQTTISFSALNYSNPTRTTYAYQIKELHKTFLPLGTQNFINLIGLSPGTYTLQVKAANEDGVWCEPKTLILIFEPKWYQTLWFKILLVVAGIAIGYGMYRYRLNQLKREESIRTRIAADLHDDIGSTLTSVRIFTDLGLAKNSTEYFPQIRAGIQEASSSLRDIIWVLDKTNNNAKQLLERVAKFALPLTVARQIDFRLIEDENLENIELGTELRRDLYLVMKEFVTNSLKYSNCQQITLTARKQNKQLYLLLKDNGTGFDPATTSRGNGLNNMVTRATNAGYTAKLSSQIGEGSSLELLPKG